MDSLTLYKGKYVEQTEQDREFVFHSLQMSYRHLIIWAFRWRYALTFSTPASV